MGPKRIVLTGGPGAGKTVITGELVRRHPHTFVPVPEAATQIYARQRTRWDRLDAEGRRRMQREIYSLQIQQEEGTERACDGKVLLLDRGTVDGAAYWPDGAEDYWPAMGTTQARELSRYDAVVWLESAAAVGRYDGDASNACRYEDPAAAIACGEAVKRLWQPHARIAVVNARRDLEEKVREVESLLKRWIA